MEYRELYRELGYKTATLIFTKKSGEKRVMLGTRNPDTIELLSSNASLAGFDKRCNAQNNNVAVMDMVLGEPRQFNVERLVSVEFHGLVDNMSTLSEVMERFETFKAEYERTHSSVVDLDSLD